MTAGPLEPNHAKFYEDMGYRCPFKLDGKVIALREFLFTVAIMVGLDEFGYETRFCYGSEAQAANAMMNWVISGDEKPSGYIKQKGNPSMNPLEQLLLDNADEQNTRHGILTPEEVAAIEETIVIGRKIDEMYATHQDRLGPIEDSEDPDDEDIDHKNFVTMGPRG